MVSGSPGMSGLSPQTRKFYCDSATILTDAKIPFLVGGAYAFERYTGIERHTKDIDLFLRPEDAPKALEVLKKAGYRTDLTFPHWLGKAYKGEEFIDLIFSSGNAIARVDDEWFKYARDAEILGLPLKIVAPEEMIWSKSFIMERERFDGADVAHVLLACAQDLDWERLVRHFGQNWRVLFSHLVLFGFVYPEEQNKLPGHIINDFIKRLQKESESPSNLHLCRGTLISREQYLYDLEKWKYQDARLKPEGGMTQDEITAWTAAIDTKK